MSEKSFVDTNILMYAHDTFAGARHGCAKALIEELWRDRTGVVSTQVLQELAVNLLRKARKPLGTKATRDVVTDYLAWQVVVNRGESVLEALEFVSRGLRLRPQRRVANERPHIARINAAGAAIALPSPAPLRAA